MNVLIAGDLFVSDRYRGKDLWDPSVRALFAGADLRIVNLEAPITPGARTQRILKTGPHLCASKETVLPLLAALRVDLVTLANNHVMDFGTPGLTQTLAHLWDAGIRSVGAGLDPAEAAKPFIFERDGLRIAVLNFGENEWAGAARGRAGANPLDPIANLEQIRAARAASEHVIVIIHGGQEDYHYPTPRMVRDYRFYAENGASAVVGHHTHCLGGYEVHRGTPIFYSLGNLVFTLPGQPESWFQGLVLSLTFDRPGKIAWELIPVAQDRTDFTVTRLDGEARDRVSREIEGYSRTIADEAALLERWEEFLKARGADYLKIFNPVNGVRGRRVRALLFRLHLDRLLRRKGQYAEVLNALRCESHSEAARETIRRMLE